MRAWPQLGAPIDDGEWLLTTMRESLGRRAEREKAARVWGRAARHAGRRADRRRGEILLAIVTGEIEERSGVEEVGLRERS